MELEYEEVVWDEFVCGMVLKVFEWIVECDGIVMKCFELYESVFEWIVECDGIVMKCFELYESVYWCL